MEIRSLIVSSMGNIIEWYDFALFIYLAPILANIFFPAHDPALATLSVFSIFALGFICRPIGGILLGHFGDRIGRPKTLRLSILLITIPTLLVSLLPTYSQVGIWSPIGLILLRMIQGIFIGGEYSGIIIYLAEMSSTRRRALVTSFAATGANIGLLMGVGFSVVCEHWLTATQLNQFGWRIAFFVGGLFGFLILYLRTYLLETPAFEQLKNKNLIAKIPFVIAIKNHYWIILKIIGLVSFGGTLFYTTFTYLTSYLQQYSQLSFKQITSLQTIFISSMLLLVPLAGILCDRIGRKNMYLLLCVMALLFTWICFQFFHSNELILILTGLAVLTIISSMEQATTLVTVVEMVPLMARYTTIALAYNLGFMIFGGVTPLILTILIRFTHDVNAPAFYLMATAVLTLAVAFFSIKKQQLKMT